MADNSTFQQTTLATISSGETYASEDVGGVKHALGKMEFGAHGAATAVDDVTNKRLPVKVGDPLPAGSNVVGGVTIADGSNTTFGAQADASAAADNSTASHMSLFKRLLARLTTLLPQSGGKLSVDGSGVTQPVSGTVTANVGATNGLALDATLTGGTAKSVNRGGAKGATTAADVTSTASGADHQPLDAVLYDASGNRLGTSGTPVRIDPTGSTTQPVSGTVTTSPPANASTNVAQVAGTATDTNSGLKSAGTQRVVLATDQPALTNALKVDGSAVTQPVSGTTRWSASPTSRSTGLTTELNALANGGFSAAGTAFDNTTNLDQYAALDVVLASLNPTGTPYLNFYLVQSLDGTTYEDAASSTDKATHQLVARIDLATGSAAKRVMSAWFNLPPGKFKLVCENESGVSLAASANTVTLYTANDKLS